jgi:hypothetical protein
MAERYVRPPLVPREASPPWVAVWRFRVTALALLVLVLILGYTVFQHLSGATSQDPGIGSTGPFHPPLLR